MPSQTATGAAKNIAGKLKAAGAGRGFDNHKSDETKFGAGGDLPAGIEQGIAKLTVAKIDEYKSDSKLAGKLYMMFTGVVVSPKEHGGVPIEGLQFNQLVGLHDKKDGKGKITKSQEDMIGIALNEMRKMGIETKGLTLEDWEDALKALEQEGPYFRFRTWAGKATAEFPNPRTNYDLRGKCEFHSNGAEGRVEDNSDPVASDSPSGDASEEDWAAIGEAADADDTDAKAKISSKAKELNLIKEVEKAENWAAGAAIIAEALGGNEGSSAGDSGEAEAPWAPEVGQFYGFKKVGARKAVEHEVTAVFKETVNLKNTETGDIIKAVKWTSDPPTLGGKPLE